MLLVLPEADEARFLHANKAAEHSTPCYKDHLYRIATICNIHIGRQTLKGMRDNLVTTPTSIDQYSLPFHTNVEPA
jgi:hypothetical protein